MYEIDNSYKKINDLDFSTNGTKLVMVDVFGAFAVSDELNDRDSYALTQTGSESNWFYYSLIYYK